MKLAPLVETTRGYPSTGYAAENVHLGSVAVVDTQGKLLWQAGDPDFMTFTRSAIKPFQALPFMLADGPARFGLSTSEVAAMLSTTENAVKIRLHRARQALRALLDERFGRPSAESREVVR